jgi:hypothetical protein
MNGRYGADPAIKPFSVAARPAIDSTIAQRISSRLQVGEG